MGANGTPARAFLLRSQIPTRRPIPPRLERRGLLGQSDEGDLGPEDEGIFDKSFAEAFACWAHARILEWARIYDHEAKGGPDTEWTSYTTLPALEEMPTRVQEAYGALIPPIDAPLRQHSPTMEPIRDTEEDEHSAGYGYTRTYATGYAPAQRAPDTPAVVGLSFGAYAQVAPAITQGALLRPRPVEDNPFDPQAVEVWWDGEGGPVRVGFLARTDTQAIRAALAQDPHLALRVCGAGPATLHVLAQGAGTEPHR